MIRTRLASIPPVLVLGLLLAPHPVAAQREPEDLDRVVESLTQMWARGEVGALVELGASPGVDLEIHGDPMGSLSGRRAAAALRQLFGDQETVAVWHGTLSTVSGADERAFVELTWDVRPTGLPFRERNRVFVGFIHEPTGWKISQIRILR